MFPSRTQSPRLCGLVIIAALAAGCSSSPPTIPEIDLSARDFAFSVPDTIQGGLVRFHVTNDGAETHHVQLIHLNAGVSRAQFDSVWASILAATQTEGGSAFFRLFDYASLAGGGAEIDPGLSTDVTLDLAAGDYRLVCFLTSPEGTPHFAKGMMGWLTVTAPPADGPAPPTADGHVELADFQFRGLPPMDSGKTTLEVTNSGTEAHEMVVMRLQGISTEAALRVLTGTAPEGEVPSDPPPFKSVGGMQAIMPGQRGWVTLDLEPGNYVLVCFIPSGAHEGKPHVQLGMIRPFTVG